MSISKGDTLPAGQLLKPGPNGPEPIHFREAFRTRGPSNYAHGKQETFHV